MRAQPRTQQRPKAFHGIDMDLMETVTILVTGVFSTAVTHALVHIPPLWQGRINPILVRIDHRAGFDRGLDERSDGLLLHVLQHDDSDLAAALDHPEDRWLFLLEGAPTGCTLEPPTTWRASLDPIGPALVASHDIHLVAFHHAAHPYLGTALDDPAPQGLRHRLTIAFVQVQLLGNLPVRHIQPHQVQVGEPHRQGLMPPHEKGPGEVVKPFSTVLAGVASAFLLPVVATALGDFIGRTTWTTHPVGPADLSDFFVTFSFIDEVVEAAHGGQAQSGQSPNFTTSSKPNVSQVENDKIRFGWQTIDELCNIDPVKPECPGYGTIDAPFTKTAFCKIDFDKSSSRFYIEIDDGSSACRNFFSGITSGTIVQIRGTSKDSYNIDYTVRTSETSEQIRVNEEFSDFNNAYATLSWSGTSTVPMTKDNRLKILNKDKKIDFSDWVAIS